MTNEQQQFAISTGKGNMGIVSPLSVTWPQLTARLSAPKIGSKEGSFWCPASFATNSRKLENVKAVALIVLDVEQKATTPPPLRDALMACSGLNWTAFAHTSYKHTVQSPRYRLILQPDRPIEPGQLRAVVTAVADRLGLSTCTDLAASRDAARLYFLPRVPHAAAKGLFECDGYEGTTVGLDSLTAPASHALMPVAPQAPADAGWDVGLLDAVEKAASGKPAPDRQRVVSDLRDALRYLSPDEYADWIAGGHDLYRLGADGEALWTEWSMRSPKWKPTDAAKWASFKDTHSDYPAIFKRAQQAGWRNPASSTRSTTTAREDFQLGMAEHAAQEEAPHLVPVSVEDVITNPSPAPEFAWDGYLPRGVVSMLGAHGGVGKSTVTLMLAVCVALGRFMFGVRTEEGPAIFVSLEDGARIIRWRLATICRVLGIDPAVLKGKLFIVDGTENPELFAAGEMSSRGPGEVTVGYMELETMAKSIKPTLIIVDNASDAFGADEINRRQVRGFIRSLGAIAKHNDCSVLLLAHVDKGTSRGEARNTEGYSGSTAWNNSVRSRLFMSRNTAGVLLLEHQKANFGKCRDPLQLIWPDGGLPQLATNSVDMSGMLASAVGRQTDAQAVELLKKMAEFEGRGEYMSPSPNARTNAVATLKSSFRGMPKDVLTELVRQCDRAKWIERMTYTTPDRKSRERWTVTQLGREFAGLPLHTQPQEEVAENQPKTEFAPSAPSAPTCHESAQGAQGAEGSEGVRQVRPHGPQGCGEWERAQLGAELGAEVSPDGPPLPGADHLTGADDTPPADGVF